MGHDGVGVSLEGGVSQVDFVGSVARISLRIRVTASFSDLELPGAGHSGEGISVGGGDQVDLVGAEDVARTLELVCTMLFIDEAF